MWGTVNSCKISTLMVRKQKSSIIQAPFINLKVSHIKKFVLRDYFQSQGMINCEHSDMFWKQHMSAKHLQIWLLFWSFIRFGSEL